MAGGEARQPDATDGLSVCEVHGRCLLWIDYRYGVDCACAHDGRGVVELGEVLRMFGVSVVGSISFASMGFLLALLVPANAAPGIVNLIYLPMSFMSGLWMPIQYLPHWLQRAAVVLPTYHLAQLMLRIFGYADHTSAVSHWMGLAGFTMVMLGTSWLVFNRAQQNA